MGSTNATPDGLREYEITASICGRAEHEREEGTSRKGIVQTLTMLCAPVVGSAPNYDVHRNDPLWPVAREENPQLKTRIIKSVPFNEFDSF